MRHSTRRVFALMISTLFLFSFAAGQDYPTAEVFGGYSYLRVDTQGLSGRSLTNECNIVVGGPCPVTFQVHPGFNGWNISPQVNLSPWFGLKAQLVGQYGNILGVKFNSAIPGANPLPNFVPRQHVYDFLFGPALSRRSEKYTLFAHGLVGAQRVGFVPWSSFAGLSTLVPPSETDTAFAVGGGLDVNASRHLAIRVGQFDYEFVNSSGRGHQDDYRFSAGVVFQVGGRH